MGDGGTTGVDQGGATIKYDLSNGGTSQTHSYPADIFPGEPSFVPAQELPTKMTGTNDVCLRWGYEYFIPCHP